MEIFNQIYVLEEGKVIQKGTHKELLKKIGKYAELLKSSNF
jgi:ABC-type transport system involved in Fe-S cluster assembly fused permease/ATPase subunit